MSNVYGVAFSNTDPRNYPSLAPTFLTFKKIADGSDITPPAISQVSTTGIYTFTYSASFSVYFLLDGITISPSTDRYIFGILDPVHRVDQQLSEYTTTFTAVSVTLTAIGVSGIALGTTSVALGISSVALGTTAVALGITTSAIGLSLMAIGTTNAAVGTTLSAIGLSLSAISSSMDTKLGTTASTFGTSASDPVDIYGYLKRVQEFLEGDATFTKSTGAWSVTSRGGSLLASKTLTNTSSTVTKD